MSAAHVLTRKPQPNFVATRNACKLCAPLGASLALRGIEGAVPFLHGSQGCATYIRRYVISHFREPMDIAASNFSETNTIFGGGEVLTRGIDNVCSQYHPALIGIATTCLTETIGEDVSLLLNRYREARGQSTGPALIPISTASYRGTHIDGFHAVVLAVVEQLASDTAPRSASVNVFPGMVSAADLRYLKEIVADFGLQHMLLPDYSDTLDGPALESYSKIPVGGTPVAAITSSGSARGSIEFGRTILQKRTAASFLHEKFSVPAHRLGMPIGISETDAFFDCLEQLSGRSMPAKYQAERGRLVDAYVDGHKYVQGKRAIVYGEEDFVVGLVSFLAEIGVTPVLCASGGESGMLASSISAVAPHLAGKIMVREGMDFMSMSEEAEQLAPDFLIGNSKGYAMARKLNAPIVRVGFPVHDRIGGQRILHLGYRGAQNLFDLVANTLLERKQKDSPIGYSYM